MRIIGNDMLDKACKGIVGKFLCRFVDSNRHEKR